VDPAEQDYELSEGAVDRPCDTESSDGLGLGFQVEDESDGDHEKYEDYHMESDDGDSGSNQDSDGDLETHLCEALKMQRKAKHQR
jgi:hypothetical protein